MRILKVVAPAVVLLGLVVALTVVRADDPAPKYTIKQVMDIAHKGDDAIYNKIKAGTASKDEKTQLVDLYSALGQNKPPKGDLDSWKSKCDALVAAAQDVAADKDGGVDELKKAAKCDACHSVHRVPKGPK